MIPASKRLIDQAFAELLKGKGRMAFVFETVWSARLKAMADGPAALYPQLQGGQSFLKI